jgi:hypothetical protein
MGGLILFILSSFSVLPATSAELYNVHAIYVSVLEVEHQTLTNSGSIKVKIFANDLEDAIYNSTKERIKLLESDCSSKLDLVEDYFKNHLLLRINNKEIKYSIDTCEVNDISIWYTFNFGSMESWRTIELTADYLIELFPTQSNVVSIKVGDDKRMFRLTKGDASETIKFDP